MLLHIFSLLMTFFPRFRNVMISFFLWILEKTLAYIDPQLMEIAQKLPDLSMESGMFMQWAVFTNSWIPLDYGLKLCIYYCAFIASILLVKWILGLIPTIN